jgi:Fe-S oxidoreductase
MDNIEFLEEEIEEGKNIKVKFPTENIGVEYMFTAPVSDYLMEADTLMGNAFALYAMGEQDNWTIGTKNYDAINYGLFYSDWILERNIKELVKEAKRLKTNTILVGECGHASRSAKFFVPVFGGENAPRVVNCVELAHKKWKEGKLHLKPGFLKEKVTYHDPCNIARSGWIVDQPREIIKAISKNYVEMSPNGTQNYCCGGGGGTVSMDEMHEYRMEIGGRKKAEQIKNTGAELLIAPCANCKKQLRELIDYHKIPVELKGLHDVLYDAIDL